MLSGEQNDLLTRTGPGIRGEDHRSGRAIDGIGPTEGWQGYWRKTDETRRKASTWASQ
jgi:hypothetical protein